MKLSVSDRRQIHIAYDFVEGPYGGGNQFLKALREEIRRRGLYAEDLNEANAIVINSFHRGQESTLRKVIRARRENPGLLVFHRVDGPYSLTRGRPEYADKAVGALNQLLADATVFQSHWSRIQCLQQGFIGPQRFEAVISNAPDPNIFLPGYRPPLRGRKVRLVASSWSKNANKGFQAYQWMDKNLDWSRFEMTFFGNAPLSFANIKTVPAIPSAELAKQLPTFDIFISAALNEPCSNALIEALHCGLPAVFYDGGGSPEIVGRAGLSFVEPEEITSRLNRIVEDFAYFAGEIEVPSISQVTDQYLSFIEEVSSTSTTRGEIERSAAWKFELNFLSSIAKVLRGLRGRLQEIVSKQTSHFA